MATKYATAVSKAGAVSQDPNAIDTNIDADTGVGADPELSSGDGAGGKVTQPNMGFAGATAVIDDTAYTDDGDSTIGTVSRFAPGHGTNTAYANEALVALSNGGVKPGGTAAVVTLTIAEPVTSTNTMTIGSRVYRFMTTPAQANDIALGANEAATKVNLVAAINGTGTPGTEYFAGTEKNRQVSAAAFSGDTCVITAREGGVVGNAYASTETFTHVSNVFSAVTLTGGKDFAWVGSLEPVGISADVALVDQNA